MWSEFPRTDFHELNLDWLLAKMKELVEEFTELETKYTTLSDAFDALKEYVDDYFSNLDLQDQVDQVFADLIASGDINELLRNALTGDLVDVSYWAPYAQVVPVAASARWSSGYSAQGFCYGTLSGNVGAFLNCFHSDAGNRLVFTNAGGSNISYVDLTVAEAGHVNSCCFDATNEQFLVATGTASLLAVDEGGLIATYTLPGDCWQVTYANGYVYCLISGNLVKYAATDLNTAVASYTMEDMRSSADYTYQGMFSDGLYIYLVCGNTRINNEQTRVNRNFLDVYYLDGKKYKTVELMYPLEIEEADFYDGTCIFASNSQYVALLGKMDLYTGDGIGYLGQARDIHPNYLTYNLYVNEDYTGFKMDGSESFPLSSLVWYAMFTPSNVSNLYIWLKADIPNHAFAAHVTMPYDISIVGGGYSLQRVNFNSPTKLSISNCTITGVKDAITLHAECNRLILSNVILGDTSITPGRSLDVYGGVEISGITFKNSATDVPLIYLVGNGYIRDIDVSALSSVERVFLDGMIDTDSTFPLDLFNKANYYGISYKVYFNPPSGSTIDLSDLYYPVIMGPVPGDVSFSGEPSGWSAADISGVIVEQVAINKSVVTIMDNDGHVTSWSNHY